MSKYVSLLIASVVISSSVLAYQYDDVEIKVTPVAGDVYMLQGAGGNIGLLATNKGLILVDDQFQPLAKKIEAAMKSIKDQPLKYVINTHYHGDHTGGNSYFSHHAPIFAHHNVRNRLADKENAEASSLPVVTYDNGLTIHLDNETVELTHLPQGHTDGDTVVYFKQANVLHTGDLFFESRFPYVDLNGGGTVKGYLANINTLLAKYPDDVKIIPGHGKLTDKAGYKALADMISYSLARVAPMVAAGKTQAQVIEAGIGDKYQSWSWQFITEEKWLKTLYAELNR